MTMRFLSNGPVRHLFSAITAVVVAYYDINFASGFINQSPSKIISRPVRSSSRKHPIITITSSLQVCQPIYHRKTICAASVTSNTDSGENESAGIDMCKQILGRALENMKAISDPDSTLLSKFNKRRISSIEVKESSITGAGLGVFAKKAIKKGSIISFYPATTIFIGFDAEEGRMISINAQGNICEQEPSESEDQDYIHYLLGKRNTDTLEVLGGNSLYIDVDPNKELCPSFMSHRINDGATVPSNSEEGVLTYYKETRLKKNCAHVPFGPIPLLATIATKKISKGEELFTSYGCQYWLGQLRKAAGEEETDMTDAIILEAKGVARDAYDGMIGVALTNSEEANKLQTIFEQP